MSKLLYPETRPGKTIALASILFTGTRRYAGTHVGCSGKTDHTLSFSVQNWSCDGLVVWWTDSSEP